jgi:REP element-mobilizing transposase RayT
MRSRVSHKSRPRLAARHPVLVTIRLRSGLPSLRRKRELALIRRRFVLAAERFDVRLVEYSVQSNHTHLIVEASNERSLARAMKGLLVRIARGLNRLWTRNGSVLDDHYHARALKTPREVRNALVYVLHNARKHGVSLDGPDPFSSGFSFDGWRNPSRGAIDWTTAPLARARSWLLSVGWRKHGRIALTERPEQRSVSTSRAVHRSVLRRFE